MLVLERLEYQVSDSMLTMVLQQVGLPVKGIALILRVDRILDMLRTHWRCRLRLCR